MRWSIPQKTTCSWGVGESVTDSYHPFHVGRWSLPGGRTEISAGTGSGGLIVSAFAGPVSTDEIAGPPGGATAWGAGSTNKTLAAGRLEFAVASPAWGALDTELTDRAALRVLLACEEPVTFKGLSSPETLALFESRSQDNGAGATGPLVTGVLAGRALDAQLADGGSLMGLGLAFEGGGVRQVDTPGSPSWHAFAPDRSVKGNRSVEPGAVTVDLVEGGAGLTAVGAAFGPLQPVPASSVVPAPNASQG